MFIKNLKEDDPRVRDAEIILDKIQKSITERNTTANFQSESSRKPFANAKGKKNKPSDKEGEGKEEQKAGNQDAEALEEEMKAKVMKNPNKIINFFRKRKDFFKN